MESDTKPTPEKVLKRQEPRQAWLLENLTVIPWDSKPKTLPLYKSWVYNSGLVDYFDVVDSMSDGGYKIQNREGVHFITFADVGRVDVVLTRQSSVANSGQQ